MAVDPTSPITMVCLTVISCQILVGIFANLFILRVVLSDFHKKKNMNSGNKIRVTMNISSIIFEIVSSYMMFYYIFGKTEDKISAKIVQSLLVYSIISWLFLTAVLCFFRFLKIVQFTSDILGWMKRNLDSVVSWLIMAAEVFSFCSSFLCFLFNVDKKPSTNTSVLTSDEVPSDQSLGINPTSFTLILILFLLPYIFVVVTTISAAGFLRLQSQKLKGLKTSVDVSRYKSTVCKMLRFLVLHTAFCCVLFFAFFSGQTINEAGVWALLIILSFYSPANSLLLILENNSLRNTWKRVFGLQYCI